MTDLFSMALQEGGSGRAGSETILAKLSELMFVEVIRCYTETLPAESRGWLSGLRDPHVGKALRLIHARPAEVWTLERLHGKPASRARSLPSVSPTMSAFPAALSDRLAPSARASIAGTDGLQCRGRAAQ